MVKVLKQQKRKFTSRITVLKQKEPCHVQQITQLLQLWDSQELLVPEEPQAPSTAPAQPYLQSFSSSFDSSVQ